MILRFGYWHITATENTPFDLYDVDLSNFSLSKTHVQLSSSHYYDFQNNKYGYGSFIANQDNFKEINFHYEECVALKINYTDYIWLPRDNMVTRPLFYLKDLQFPLYLADNTSISDNFVDKDTVIAFDSVPCSTVDSYDKSTFSSNAFLTVHWDKTFDKSYIMLYIPTYYNNQTNPKFVMYSIYKMDLNIKFTNCCLKQCVEPTKYIFYKG